VSNRRRRVTRTWGADEAAGATTPRNGFVVERDVGDGRFEQEEGPFSAYVREVRTVDGRLTDTTRYRIVIPWFGWIFALPIRATLRGRWRDDGSAPGWAAPDRLTAVQVKVLGLLAAASMSGAFVNTLFTQTVNFAADDFGIGERSQAVAGVLVRCGIVLALPFLVMADRVGRRRIIVLLAWLAPVCAALGALAPSFWVLTGSQVVGRPLGIALDLLIAVAVAEAMPRNSRAYSVSLLAMASGLGAGVAVGSLPLADLGPAGWRLVYVVSLVWLLVALDLTRRLPETPRFEALQERRAAGSSTAARAHVRRGRFLAIAAVGLAANLFVAPASYFQNRYLDDVRGYTGAGIALFTIATATPASIGLVIGGRLADTAGRRRVLALALPASTALLVVSFFVPGRWMWASAFFGGLLGGTAYPAFAVYRTEMFPTARRGQVGGFVAATGLIGGSVGLITAGVLLDREWSYGSVMAMLGVGQLVAAAIVMATYPETAHRALEDLNPDDRELTSDTPAVSGGGAGGATR
jgi:MFS family permease